MIGTEKASRRIAWALRALVLAAVAAAIAQPTWTLPTGGRATVVVLADRSASMPPDWAGQMLRQLLRPGSGQLRDADLLVYGFAGASQKLETPANGNWAEQLSPADPADGSDPGPAARMAGSGLAAQGRSGGGRLTASLRTGEWRTGAPRTGVPLLLLSDGNWTAPADWAADWPGPIWAMCPAGGRANAGLVDLAAAVSAPSTQAAGGGPSASLGEPPPTVAIRATVSSTRDGPAIARLFAVDPLTGQAAPAAPPRELELRAGQLQTVDWQVVVGGAPVAASPPDRLTAAPQTNGLPGPLQTPAQFRADLAADWDELPGDNSLTILAPAPGQQRTCLLITTGTDGPTRKLLLAAADRAAGRNWRVLTLSPRQANESSLLRSADPVGGIVLDDVPADALSERFLADLRQYVQSGGGLLVIGGGHSLAAGHYYDSPLEALLPVRSRPREHPPAAVALVLDRSGSMSEPPTLSSTAPAAGAAGPSKLDLVRQAVLSLPDLFGPADRLAVIGFSDQAKTVYATAAGGGVDWQSVRRALVEMPASGGTAVGPALRSAAEWLALQDTPRKHLLLLSDGKFSDLTIEQALGVLGKDKAAGTATAPSAPGRLTVSTFAVSNEAEQNFEFLSQLAAQFGGTYYPPGDWGRLREQFRDDLAGATAAERLVGPIKVVPMGQRPGLPDIDQMLTCELLPSAGLWYYGKKDDGRAWPLVATGPLGAGRTGVVATSFDLGWAETWQRPGAALLAELLDDLAGPDDDPRFVLQIASVDPDLGESAGRGGWQLTVDARELAERLTASRPTAVPMNLLDLSAELTDATGRTRSFALPQVGPGRYSAAVPPAGACRLAVVLRAEGKDRPVLRRTIAPPLPAEFSHLGPRPEDLDKLCRDHGGRLLDRLDQLTELDQDLNSSAAPRKIPLAPWLLLAAVVLWLAELVLTRRTP